MPILCVHSKFCSLWHKELRPQLGCAVCCVQAKIIEQEPNNFWLQEQTKQIDEPEDELYEHVRVRHEVRGAGKVVAVDFNNPRGKPYTIRLMPSCFIATVMGLCHRVIRISNESSLPINLPFQHSSNLKRHSNPLKRRARV